MIPLLIGGHSYNQYKINIGKNIMNTNISKDYYVLNYMDMVTVFFLNVGYME